MNISLKRLSQLTIKVKVIRVQVKMELRRIIPRIFIIWVMIESLGCLTKHTSP